MDVRIAAMLNYLPINVNAKPAYEVYSGGLVWSDELPQPGVLRRLTSAETMTLWHDVLRHTFRHRTAVICGEDPPNIQVVDGLRRLAPKWPGFTPSRWSKSLVHLVRQLEIETLAELDALQVEIDTRGFDAATERFGTDQRGQDWRRDQ